MIDLSAVDLEELAMALGDQDGYEHHWLIDPDSGQISLWTEDGGIDGEHPVDLDEVDLIGIHPLPSYVWYQDMADSCRRNTLTCTAVIGPWLRAVLVGRGFLSS